MSYYSIYLSVDYVKFRTFAVVASNGTYFVMDFKPQYYRSHPLSLIVKLESVYNKHGTLMYAVTLSRGVKDNTHFLFHHLSSAIDFINSNFG